jgi:hypothetical protein
VKHGISSVLVWLLYFVYYGRFDAAAGSDYNKHTAKINSGVQEEKSHGTERLYLDGN